ncbi:MAG: peptidoglycan DD-metalloendopeptidase family protein [Rhizobiaceae bacterium]
MWRGAALIALGSLVAGCSSDVSRFTDTKIFTGSTANQRAIIKGVENQPYPGDVIEPAAPDGTYTGSVNRGALKPVDLTRNDVSRGELAPVETARRSTETTVARAADRPVSLLKPAGAARAVDPTEAVGKKVDTLDTLETGSVDKAATTPTKDRSGETGWTATGGTRVTLREGETIYNLSRRFGVPAKAILKANGITDPTAVAAGSTIVIPTYVYARNAPISAPDNDPKVAKASSGRGEKVADKEKRVPAPSPAPQRQAVLPSKAAVRDRIDAGAADEAKSARADTGKGATHKVVSGDTLYDIARKYGTTTAALKQANGLSNGLIRVGQVLRLPAAGETVVARAPREVDPIITGTAGPSADKSRKTNRLPQYTPPAKKKDTGEVIKEAKADVGETPGDSGIGKMRWPARGRVITAFGKVEGGRKNDGIDIAVPSGTPVKAAENGVVIYAGDGLKEFGNTVLVRHDDGLVTVYGHASSLLVSRGDKVRRGQDIARSGMSGSTDVPKLHFEVREKSVPVDPSGYLP